MPDLLEESRRRFKVKIIAGFDLAQHNPRGRHLVPDRHKDLVAPFYACPYRDENPCPSL